MNAFHVSFFGIEAVSEIPLRIVESYKSGDKEKSAAEHIKEGGGKAVSHGSSLLSAIPFISDHVDVKSLASNYSSLLYKLIPKENTVIFLDDIERVIDTLGIHTLLEAINDLVKQRGYKVVVIVHPTAV